MEIKKIYMTLGGPAQEKDLMNKFNLCLRIDFPSIHFLTLIVEVTN